MIYTKLQKKEYSLRLITRRWPDDSPLDRKVFSPGTRVCTRRNRTCPRVPTSIDLGAGSNTTDNTRNWAFAKGTSLCYATLGQHRANTNRNINYAMVREMRLIENLGHGLEFRRRVLLARRRCIFVCRDIDFPRARVQPTSCTHPVLLLIGLENRCPVMRSLGCIDEECHESRLSRVFFTIPYNKKI